MVELNLVKTSDQIRESLAVYVSEARAHSPRALLLLRQTTYFVYDDDEGSFGPSKYVGFVGMSLQKYEQALKKDYTGARFDGFVARTAIESALSVAFATDDALGRRLKKWAESLFGPSAFEGVDETKWAFVRVRAQRSYWAFMANPEIYNIEQALAEATEDNWTVERSDVQAGDRVAIWKAKGRGRRRGIVAFAEVLTNPRVMLPKSEHMKYYLGDELMSSERRVTVRYVLPPRVPLWISGNDSSKLLEGLSVARASGGTVFKVPPEQWSALVDASGGWPQSNVRPEISASSAVDALRLPRGGFQPDSGIRQAVEQYAMTRARKHFEDLGYSVRTVGKPYDLLCERGGGVVYVEVKGTQSDGTEVLLTPNEVLFANSHRNEMALFLVHSITASRTDLGVTAAGGVVHIDTDWRIDLSRLSALGYSYTLQENSSREN